MKYNVNSVFDLMQLDRQRLELTKGVAFSMGEVRPYCEVLLSAYSAVNGTFLHRKRTGYDKY